MAPTAKPLINLTIYLLKPSTGPEESLIKKSKKGLTKYGIGTASHPIGNLYVELTDPKPPRWAKYFGPFIASKNLGEHSSVSAVFIVNADKRRFAITFGSGRYLLVPDSYEERFGLIVALNCLGEHNVRGIDKRTFDSISRHSKEQASKETSARDFGLDVERDLLRAVTGSPLDTSYGIKMYGMDALNTSIRADIKDAKGLLSRLNKKFGDQSYKQNFPWVDQISEVGSLERRKQLDEALIARLRKGHCDRIWMAVPELVPWERVKEFRFGYHSPGFADIHLADFLASLKDAAHVDIQTLSRHYVVCLDNDEIPIDKWAAYKCLYAEIDDGKDSYLLSGGKWYKVSRDFVAEINSAYQKIPDYSAPLPEYDDLSETAYNKRVAATDLDRIVLMDRRMIAHGGGYSRIEFCDLYTANREIFHIKRYGGSSVLSHLFSQGLISGELFQVDSIFRQKINNILPTQCKLKDAHQRPPTGEYKIIFGIISDMPGPLVLPFFSRLNLKHAVTRLSGFGYSVAKAKISVANKDQE